MTRDDFPTDAEGWFARMNSGAQPSLAEERAFRAWLEAAPQNAANYRACMEAWVELGVASDAREMLALRSKALAEAAGGTRRWAFGAGAAALAAALAGIWIARPFDERVETRPGERVVRMLADGSELTLAPGSLALVSLSANSRAIRLARGQLFIHVAQDPARPLRVIAGSAVVTAIGTRFDVRRTEAGVAVLVEEGRVELAEHGRRAILSANQAAAESREARAPSVTTIPSAAVRDRLAWREGRLVFVDQPLSEVADQFNRYASTRLVIADARAGAVRISGSFYYTGAGEFADALRDGFGLSVERSSGSEWIIRSPG